MTVSLITVDISVNQGTIRRELGRNRCFRGYRFLQAHRFCSAKRLSKEGCGACDDALPHRTRRKHYRTTISGALSKSAVHSTTKTAQKSVMKAFIGTSDRQIHRRSALFEFAATWQKVWCRTTAGRGLILGRFDIAHRPAIVDAKSHLSDWELDSIIGAKYKGDITSTVELKTKLTAPPKIYALDM